MAQESSKESCWPARPRCSSAVKEHVGVPAAIRDRALSPTETLVQYKEAERQHLLPASVDELAQRAGDKLQLTRALVGHGGPLSLHHCYYHLQPRQP